MDLYRISHNQIPCSKCHGDIGDEMVATGDKANGAHISMMEGAVCGV